jgi:hypothetical protein
MMFGPIRREARTAVRRGKTPIFKVCSQGPATAQRAVNVPRRSPAFGVAY